MHKVEAILFEHRLHPLAPPDRNDGEWRQIFNDLDSQLADIWKSRLIYGGGRKWEDGNDEEVVREDTQRLLELDYCDFAVCPREYVGIVQTEDLRLTILPKIFQNSSKESSEERIEEASKDLLYLLSYAEKIRPPRSSSGPLKERKKLDFFELFIRLFASETADILEREFYRSYQELEENLPYIKGKILFPEHVRRNLLRARQERIFCQFDLFQEDNVFNRILKFVTRRLLSKSRDDDNKRLLRGILAKLTDVSDAPCRYEDTHRVVFNNSQREWIPILNYCKLFLRQSLVSYRSHNLQVFCFLLDMNSVFEGFVAGFLKKHFRDWNVEVQKSNLSVAQTEDGQDVFQMQHDIFMTKGEQSIIIDTKYKETNFSEKDGGIKQADVYQLATYAVRRGVRDIILLYPRYLGDQGPAEKQFFIHEAFSGQKIRLRCCKLQLTELPDSTREKDQVLYDQLRQVLELDQEIQSFLIQE